MEAYLDELVKGHLIVPIIKGSGTPKETTDCIVAKKINGWDQMHSKDKYKTIAELIHAFVPEVKLSMHWCYMSVSSKVTE